MVWAPVISLVSSFWADATLLPAARLMQLCSAAWHTGVAKVYTGRAIPAHREKEDRPAYSTLKVIGDWAETLPEVAVTVTM